MAFPSSGLFVPTWVDMGDATQLAIDFDVETHKFALFTNAVAAPDLVTDTAYGVGPWAANECPATGNYVTGGFVLTGTTYLSTGAGVVTFDATDWSVASSTITARGGQLYADALAGNNAIAAINFGADFISTGGLFLVAWHALGIFTQDIIP
jgi:hypothetical protein